MVFVGHNSSVWVSIRTKPTLEIRRTGCDISGMIKRDQFRTLLRCARCGAAGHAVWEENTEMAAAGPMGTLVSMSDNFILQAPRNDHGQPVIACKTCGTVQPD
jgi:L-lactate utilization protein LutB